MLIHPNVAIYHDHENVFECMMYFEHIHPMSFGSLGPECMPLSKLPDKVRQHRGASAEVEAAWWCCLLRRRSNASWAQNPWESPGIPLCLWNAWNIWFRSSLVSLHGLNTAIWCYMYCSPFVFTDFLLCPLREPLSSWEVEALKSRNK